ncbi:MAG: hypothetical protein WCG10_00390 [Chlamydiota bacterium]
MTASSYRIGLSSEGFELDHKPVELVLAEHEVLYDPKVHHGCSLFVDLSLSSPLIFKETLEKAHSIQSQGGLIFWNLHFDFLEALHFYHFEGLFNASAHGLKVFSEKVLSVFGNCTVGCSVFQGSCDFASLFSWKKAHYQGFIEWLVDTYKTPAILFETTVEKSFLFHAKFEELSLEILEVTPFGQHIKNVYSATILAGYLHRLAAVLPEDVLTFVCLDARGVAHEAYLYQLLSKERFAHLNLAIKGSKIPIGVLTWDQGFKSSIKTKASVGICFPNDPYCIASTLNKLKKCFLDLSKRSIAYRIIPEFLMTESWDGLDEVIFIKDSLSAQGKRILQGFSIAGGSLVYLDQPIGLDPECSYQKFLENFT